MKYFVVHELLVCSYLVKPHHVFCTEQYVMRVIFRRMGSFQTKLIAGLSEQQQEDLLQM